MKHQKLFSLCKKKGCFIIFGNEDNKNQNQWLGTDAGLFLIEHLPYLTKSYIIALLDITPKQQEKTIFKHESNLPICYNFGDSDESEKMLEQDLIAQTYKGDNVQPLFTSQGIKFINTALLEPFADVADMIEIYERFTEDGHIYFAVKFGMMLKAIIMPINILSEDFVTKIETLAIKCRAALNEQVRKEK